MKVHEPVSDFPSTLFNRKVGTKELLLGQKLSEKSMKYPKMTTLRLTLFTKNHDSNIHLYIYETIKLSTQTILQLQNERHNLKSSQKP